MTAPSCPSIAWRARVTVACTACVVTLTLILGAEASRRKDEATAPSEAAAVKLFSGSESDLTANWVRRGSPEAPRWQAVDGVMKVRGGDIQTKEEFGDFQLHVEFKVPLVESAKLGSQGRGNSGVYLQGRYEIQVLDSYGVESPGSGQCGGLYNQAAPLVNACKPPREWQSYDIVFRSARVDNAGAITEKPRATVFQNGILIHNNQQINGPTHNKNAPDSGAPGPIILQDHGHPVEYRNIWIRKLPAEGANHY